MSVAVGPVQRRQRVGEGREEQAERVVDLRLSDEQHGQARRIGGAAELDHQEGDGEDHAGERHHPRGDGGEALAGGFHRQSCGEVGQKGVLEPRQQDGGQGAGRDIDQRDDPERRSGVGGARPVAHVASSAPQGADIMWQGSRKALRRLPVRASPDSPDRKRPPDRSGGLAGPGDAGPR